MGVDRSILDAADKFLADADDVIADNMAKRAFDNLFAGWREGQAYADALKAYDDFLDWSIEERERARKAGEFFSNPERYEGEHDELIEEMKRLRDEFPGAQIKGGWGWSDFERPEDSDPDGPDIPVSDAIFLPYFTGRPADLDAYAYSCAFFGEPPLLEENYGNEAKRVDYTNQVPREIAQYKFWETVRRHARETA